jgi:DNA-binding transcriptional LysR family regulator
MPINFRQLEVFRAVAETKSFTRASHVLFISQSTVSQPRIRIAAS